MGVDEQFSGVTVCVGTQSAFNTYDSGVDAAAGDLTLADGLILGDAESGDAESGVTLPNFVGQYRKVADLAGGFTQQADSFQKMLVEGFQFSFLMQGNGQDAGSPTAEAANFTTSMPGIQAIMECIGLIDGTGAAAPTVEYTARTTASSGGITSYTTWKVWVGDLAFVLNDCLISSATMVFTPGGNCVVTCDVAVGALDHTTAVDGVDAVTSTDYEELADVAAPTVEGVEFTWDELHGFENLTIVVENETAEFGDSNVATTGVRQAQTARTFKVSGVLYVDTDDSDFHYRNLFGDQLPAGAPTADLSLQMGTVSGASDTLNAFKIEVNALQPKDIKYNRIGSALVCELNDSKATHVDTAGGEFKLTMN